MRVRLAVALLCLTLATFPAAARIFWPSSDGDYMEGYRNHLFNCPAVADKPCGVKLFIDLQSSKVPDEKTAVQIAQDYIAAHPWPAVADGYYLKFRLEDHDGLTWHGIIMAPGIKAAHALIDGKIVPPITSRPVGHIWVKPDGRAFYPVGYK